jgi:hypothetical protein
VEHLRAHPGVVRRGIEIFQGDLRNDHFNPRSFDVVIWWHGPEHVEAAELPPALRLLEGYSRSLVLLACPDGEDPYEDEESDDVHLNHITHGGLEAFGYETRVVSREDEGNPVPAAIALKDVRNG